MRSFDVAERRARLVARHHLAGDAGTPLAAATDVVALHATDPATVYLSVLARCASATLSDVSAAMYDERSLVRMMAMRRTLFVVPEDLVPVVHQAASLPVAVKTRNQLVKMLATSPTEPELPKDVAGWLEDVEQGVEAAARKRGSATGEELSRDEPRLRTAILPTTDKAYDIKRNITTWVLTLMGMEARLVRLEPKGSWTSRRHTWAPGSDWWPTGIPDLEPEVARRQLVEAYLRRFGPATEADVAWWTGWALGLTRQALTALDLAEVALGASPGWVLADDVDASTPVAPSACLLPSLDPTPMGWKERSWFLPPDPRPLYDNNGNIGPTIWWAGEVVGGWVMHRDGSIATRLLVDRGKAVEREVAKAAGALLGRLDGRVVVPSFRTPLDRELSE